MVTAYVFFRPGGVGILKPKKEKNRAAAADGRRGMICGSAADSVILVAKTQTQHGGLTPAPLARQLTKARHGVLANR